MYVCYIVNIFLFLNTAQYDQAYDELTTERRQILIQYFKSPQLLLDIMIVFPLFAFHLTPLNIILMVCRMPSVVKQIKHCLEERRGQGKQDMLQVLLLGMEKVHKYEKTLKLLKVVIIFMFFNHLACCLFHFLVTNQQSAATSPNWANTYQLSA